MTQIIQAWRDMAEAPASGIPTLVWDLHREEAVLVSRATMLSPWCVDGADGVMATMDGDFRPRAWIHVPHGPDVPFRSRIPSRDGFPSWRSIGTAPHDGVPLLTWHPSSRRVLLTLWDLGCYSERRDWCVESANGERWDAAPAHGPAAAWMPAPVMAESRGVPLAA